LSKVVHIKTNAKINLVFYKNENGKPPSEEIWKSFTIRCKPGKKITTKNFKTPIQFPDEGLFIGFEWIINEENSYTQKVTYDKKNSKNETFINPEIYYQKSEKNELYAKIKSMWMKINQKEKYNHLSIEIDLTD